MSIFKYILSPFIEFKEPDPATSSSPNNAAQSSGTYTTSASNNITPTPVASVPKMMQSSDDFKLYFERLIEEANQKNPVFQGTDLKEYLDTKVELDTITDEQAKIRTAFNVLKRTGLTKEKLLNTGQEYIRLIDKDLAGIESAFNQQYKQDVEAKESQIQSKSAELQALTQKIATLNQEISQISQQITQSKQQLTQNKNQFVAAGQSKKSEIETELQKINQYL